MTPKERNDTFRKLIKETEYWKEEARRYCADAEFWKKKHEELAKEVNELRMLKASISY